MTTRSRWLAGLLSMHLGVLGFGCITDESDDDPAPRVDAGSPDAGGPDSKVDGGTGGKTDGGSKGTVEQTVTPYVTGAGIGVSDLSASTKFYTEALGLTFKYNLDTEVWNENVLADVRGNSVVIMDFVKERNTQDNPAKLVFAVKSVTDAVQKVIAAGGKTFSPPTTFAGSTVALMLDPDGYLVELIEAPTAPSAVLVGVGVGVSDLDASQDYYTRVLGLRFSRDIDVPGFMDEKELKSPLNKGPSVILMHYEKARSYENVPVKIVLAVSDATKFTSVVAAEDPAKLIAPAAPYGNTGYKIGMAADLEGTLIEVLESTVPRDAGIPDAGARDGGTARVGLDAGR